MANYIIISLSLLTLLSCKTQEDIEREKLVNSLNIGLKQVQQLTTEQSARLDEIDRRLMEATGKFEEVGHETRQQTTTEFTSLKKEIILLKEKNKSYESELKSANKRLGQVRSRLKTQSAYSKQVLSTLKDISGKNKGLYEQSMENYGRRNYTLARDQFLILLEDKKIKGRRRERIMHNLGISELGMKKYEGALVAFSKLITSSPKSIYVPSAMLNMARTFLKMNDKESAIQTLEELIATHPKHKRGKIGKKLLLTIKK